MEEERHFNLGMNTDDEERLIADGQSRRIEYLRSGSTESSNQGARESFEGNSEIVMPEDFLPDGTNTLIGSCPFSERNAFILFYHNSEDNHTIVYLDVTAQTYTILLTAPVLGFDLDYPIYDARIVNNLLKWTDGKNSDSFWNNGARLFNPPMGLNIDTAAAGGYITLDLQSFEALKWPPHLPPIAAYGSIDGVPNKLGQLSFEFMQQNIYKDNEYSAWGPISEMPLPTNDEWVQGIDYSNIYADNKIDVTVNTGHYTIKKFRLAVRLKGTGQFRIFHEVDKAAESLADDVEFTYEFFNNQVFSALPLAIPNNDNVPQVAKRQEVIPITNEIAYGNYWRDYNNVEVDYELGYVSREITNFKPVALLMYASTIGFTFKISFNAYTIFNLSVGDTYTFSVQTLTPDMAINLSYALTQPDIDDAALEATVMAKILYILNIIGQAFAVQLSAATGSVVTGSIVGTEFVFSATPSLPYADLTRNSGNPVRALRKSGVNKCLHDGWTYYMALLYEDRGNNDGTVQKLSSAVKLDVAWPSNEPQRALFANPNSPYYNTFKMLVNSIPPIWASHYSVVVVKVSTSFEERVIIELQTDPNLQNTFMISLDAHYELAFQANINHQIQVGDIVRLKTKNYPTTLAEPAEYVEELIERQVLKYDPTGGFNNTEAIWVSQFDPNLIRYDTSPGDVRRNSQLIEIYTPIDLADQSPWFKIATYEVLGKYTDNRRHAGSGAAGIVQRGLSATSTFSANGNWLFYDDYRITFDLSGGLFTATIVSSTINADGTTQVVIDTPFPSSANLRTFTINTEQTETLPARLDPDWGDCYSRQRETGTGISLANKNIAYYYIKDPTRSDYYPPIGYHLGQISLERSDNRRVHLKSGIIHSGSYLDESTINNLSNFTGLSNFKILSESDGELTRMKSDGQTLHCILEWASYPVYKYTYGSGGDGTEVTPVYQSETFSSVGRRVEAGSRHPGSVQRIGKNIFFYDFYRSSVWVLTDNGHDDITEGKFKFKSFITAKTIQIQANYSDTVVFSSVDEANKEYAIYFTVDGVMESPVFNYEKGQWDMIVSHPLIWAENLGSYLISSDGYKIYRHNEGDDSKYYGEIYTPLIEFPFNANFSQLKKPLALKLESDQKWEVSEVTVLPSVNYPSGMTSMIPAGLFEPKENFLWSAYLNDSSNIVPEIPDLVDADHALINGRNLVGPAFMHTMIAAVPGVKVVLFAAKMTSDPSRPLK